MGKSISIIGMGKLGASMAAAFALRGYDVWGVDVNPETIRKIKDHEPPVEETGLAEIYGLWGHRIIGTADYWKAVENTDATFIVVNTPSEPDGKFSLKYVRSVAEPLGKALARKKGYHLVSLTSTVLPGSTRHGLAGDLEKWSGKECGKDFGLCYSPEFIALGSVVHDFLNPDFLLIGEWDERSGTALEAIYEEVMENDPPIKRMSLENAELAKIALNTFVTTKISYANMLARVCEQIPGGDIDVVTDAIGSDSRIGKKYLRGGLGYGGPCFPRDNRAFLWLAKQLEVPAPLPVATDAINRSIPDFIIRKIKDLIKDGATVAVLGMAYKPDTCILEESQAYQIGCALIGNNCTVEQFDPMITREKNLREMVKGADLVVIANPDPVFTALTPNDLKPGAVVIDQWRSLKKAFGDYVHYHAAGLCDRHAPADHRLKQMWSER